MSSSVATETEPVIVSTYNLGTGAKPKAMALQYQPQNYFLNLPSLSRQQPAHRPVQPSLTESFGGSGIATNLAEGAITTNASPLPNFWRAESREDGFTLPTGRSSHAPFECPLFAVTDVESTNTSGFETDEFNLLEDLDLSLLDNSYSGLVRRDENSHESGPVHTAVSLNTIAPPSPTLHPFVCSPVMDPVPGLASPNSLSFSESPQYFPNANETFAVSKPTTTVMTDQTVRDLAALVEQQKTIIMLLKQQAAGNHERALQRNNSNSRKSTRQTANGAAKTRKKRGALDPSARLQTAETRELAACVRCQRVRKRCIPGSTPDDPCLGCLRVKSLSLRIPCIRTRVSDVTLFRTTNTENDTWTKRQEIYELSELSNCSSHTMKALELTHDFGPVLSVYVRPFDPIEGDVTSYVQTDKDGKTQELEVPCYAIARLEDVKTAINKYVDDNIEYYLENYLDSADFLMWETFRLAMQRAYWQKIGFSCDTQHQAKTNENQSALLQKILRLWMASRLIEKPWRICGDETLGMKVTEDPGSKWCGRIPVSPVMDTQLDRVVIQNILQPLRQEVLKMLQEKISKKKRGDWFEIFATIFIMLNSVEIATAHDHEFATFFGHYTPGRGSRFEDYRLIESYFHSAQTLIAHFRDSFHGQVPFTKDWESPEMPKLAEVNIEEAAFLGKLKDHLTQRKNSYEKLKHDNRYENLLYWGHQLFFDTWDPTQVYIKEMNE